MRGLGITDWGDADFRPHFVRHRRYAALPPAEAVQQTDRRGDGEVNNSHWTKPKKTEYIYNDDSFLLKLFLVL